MKITVITLFPELFTSVLSTSILKRAIGANHVEVEFIQIRDFTQDKFRRVDSPPIGGGAGLVLKAQPLFDILTPLKGKKILLTPRGKTYDQVMAKQFAQEQNLILICGHYEGFDERVHTLVDDMVSIGDYILTGGEIAALAIIDSVARLIPGVIEENSPLEESFEHHLLEYPQYTEPFEINGFKVPPILYSGNHEAIRKWRLKQSLAMTLRYRPDLLKLKKLTTEEKVLLKEIEDNRIGEWEILAIEKGKKFTQGKS
jgi:tRNA (guanine37-N1)-methyltransferase